MTRQERIRQALRQAFNPISVDVVDESHLHAGHPGSPGTGETHFRVVVESEAFVGVGRLQRQRQVNRALASEFETGLHALSIRALAPGEPRKTG